MKKLLNEFAYIPKVDYRLALARSYTSIMEWRGPGWYVLTYPNIMEPQSPSVWVLVGRDENVEPEPHWPIGPARWYSDPVGEPDEIDLALFHWEQRKDPRCLCRPLYNTSSKELDFNGPQTYGCPLHCTHYGIKRIGHSICACGSENI